MDNNPQNQQPQPPPGELAKSDYNSGTPVTPYQGQQPQPGFQQPDYQKQAAYPPPNPIQQAYQQPQYGQQAYVRPLRNPNLAFLLELLGYVGFLGIGHLYAGNIIGGAILLLFGWGIAIFLFKIGVILSIFTLGLGLCLIVPLFLAVPLISGFWARRIANRNNAVRR